MPSASYENISRHQFESKGTLQHSKINKSAFEKASKRWPYHVESVRSGLWDLGGGFLFPPSHIV